MALFLYIKVASGYYTDWFCLAFQTSKFIKDSINDNSFVFGQLSQNTHRNHHIKSHSVLEINIILVNPAQLALSMKHYQHDK